MKKTIVIYDDVMQPNKEIKSITGDKSYGETIFKRVTLKDRIKQEVLKNKAVSTFLVIEKIERIEKLKEDLISQINPADQTAIVYMYSNYGLADTKEFQTLLSKASYADQIYLASCDGQVAAVLLPDVNTCMTKLGALANRQVQGKEIENQIFTDLSVIGNFLNFITGGFDARFFNALLGDTHTVTKRSTKKEKIKAEYEFYYLLPDNMKMWFVMPYDYREDEQGASYTMERFHMTDIAIRFVHGAVSTDELSDILDKLFYFINLRERKAVDAKTMKAVADELYIKKPENRMADLKKLPEYAYFDTMIRMGSDYDSIDDVIKTYEDLYEKVNKLYPVKEHQLVIGHGDLCFSNILYSREASLLKLIDPKGALTKEELYTDPYYDLAKLSHSICGSYDFFNTGLYQITIERDMKLKLSIDTDAQGYIEVFKTYLEKNGFSYTKVRLLEAGLFLSMLPYHMDQPGKVFGFLLNAIRILEEVKKECTRI